MTVNAMGFPDHFATERLRAERLTAAHEADIAAMHRDAEQMAMLGGVRDEAQTAAYMERNLRHWDEFGFGLWLLRDPQNGEICGRGLLRHVLIDGVDEVETGYGFYATHWGRGLATEVADACVQLGRERLGLTSIVAITGAGHVASQRVMVKAGMVFDRALDGSYEGHVLYRTAVGEAAGVAKELRSG
ncbi:MAG TPA: GNAT family N-acetyltransferase [Gemmatimonadales bacterium]